MLISQAYAQTAPSGPGGMDIMSLLPLILMFVLLYFLLLRPQMRRAKEQKQMLTSLQKRGLPPRDPNGALHSPIKAGETRGDQPVYVMRTSLYTRASLHPAATAAAMLSLGLVVALALTGKRRNGT